MSVKLQPRKLRRLRRIDGVPIGRARPTPQGGIRAPANPTREGIFEYVQHDGSVRREYHPADVVFAASTLDSLAASPVTIGHPPVPVTKHNWDTYAVGHVGDEVQRDGHLVLTEIVVQKAEAVDGVLNLDLVELSCGYEVECEDLPGVWNGQTYDAIVRSIKYNHLALLRRGAEEPRAGAEARVRLDSSGNAIQEPRQEITMSTQRTLKIDGLDLPADSDAAAQAIARLDAKVDLLEKQVEGVKADGEKEKARADAAEAELAKVQGQLKEARDPEKLEALVAARAKIRSDAAQLLGDEDLSGKSDREVMIAAILKATPEAALTEATDEYVRARFDQALAYGLPPTGDESGPAKVRRAVTDAIKGKAENEETPAKTAEERMKQRTEDAWKAPHGAHL